MFDEINANKLIKHRFHDQAIETKIFFFLDFIHNLFITTFEIFRKYLKDNFKKNFIVFCSLSTNTFIMFIKKKPKIYDNA